MSTVRDEARALEWEECRGGAKPRWQAQAFMGQYYEISYDEGHAVPYYADTLDEEFHTLEAAKAACQADFAKRIQSALTAKPAPVVSDEIPDDVLQAVGTIRGFDAEEAPDSDQAHREWFSAVIAALSTSPTEADIRARERARGAEHVRSQMMKALMDYSSEQDMPEEAKLAILELHESLSWVDSDSIHDWLKNQGMEALPDG